MGISSRRMSHMRFIIEKRYKTESSIKSYILNTWIPKAEEILGMTLKLRNDKKHFAIRIEGRKHKNIFAFIDKETGDIMRPKSFYKAHTRYQPKEIKSNINDKDGGMRYVNNVKFKYLP
jgi:hypothetical protein